MKKIRIAVVGCGNIGKRHLAILDTDSRFEVVAACDKNQAVIDELARLYNISLFTDYDQLLKEIQLDYISICTPHFLHEPMAIEALEKGVDTLVEKPMALTTSSCENMISASQKSGKKLFVVHQNRYNVPVVHLKKALDEEKLGKLYMVQCNVIWNRNVEYYSNNEWRGIVKTEGGALFTQASHFIDLITWLFGDVENAKAVTERKHHNIEFEDCGSATLAFSSGVVGNLFWTNNAYRKNYEGSITVIGEKGTVKIGGKYLNELEYWEVEDYPLPAGIDFTDKPNVYDKYKGSSSNHDKLFNELAKCENNEQFCLVDGYEAMKTVNAIELIYNSAKG